MQGNATQRKTRGDTYLKVFDRRNRRVRGLWQRGGRYFANLTVTDDLGRKASKMIPLAGGTVPDAIAEMRRLLNERADDRVRPVGLTPKLEDYAQTYRTQLEVSGKRPATISKEVSCIAAWASAIGHLRLSAIRPHHITKVMQDFGGKGLSGRTQNLYLIALRGLFKSAARDGHVRPPFPFEGIEWKRFDHKKRSLVTLGDFDLICDVAEQASKNGAQLRDYLRFIQFSGARRNEALEVRWRDVDFDQGQVTIGAEGGSKNRHFRVVDFNPSLKALLTEMAGRKQPDSEWLFPSPQRGEKDVPAKTFREAMELTKAVGGFVCLDCKRPTVASALSKCPGCGSVRLEAASPLLPARLQSFGFHDARHTFISYAVMSGIDFMTVAKWVGHLDGGILIGKVYGHLADDHRRSQALKLNFGPAIQPLSSVVG